MDWARVSTEFFVGVSTEFLVRVSTEFLVGEHEVPSGRDENGDSAWGEHGVNDGVSTEFLVGVSTKFLVGGEHGVLSWDKHGVLG